MCAHTICQFKFQFTLLKVKSQLHMVIGLHSTCISSHTHLTSARTAHSQINTHSGEYFRCILGTRMIHDHTMELWSSHDSIEIVSLTSFNEAINSCSLQSLDKHAQTHRLCIRSFCLLNWLSSNHKFACCRSCAWFIWRMCCVLNGVDTRRVSQSNVANLWITLKIWAIKPKTIALPTKMSVELNTTPCCVNDSDVQFHPHASLYLSFLDHNKVQND